MKKSNRYPKQYIYQQIVQAKLFIDDNFDEQIVLDQIARKAHFSKFHFIRLFKTIYGKTPNQYLTLVRIEKAKELLESKITVRQVCMCVGFESLSSFKALFKRHTKYTPAIYRKRQSDFRSATRKTPLRFIPHCLSKMGAINRKAIFKTLAET